VLTVKQARFNSASGLQHTLNVDEGSPTVSE